MDVHLQNPVTSITPGTSGVRKKVDDFKHPHIVEVYTQSTLQVVGHKPGISTFIIGGDGRFLNEVLFHRILNVLAGNNVEKVIVPINLLMSTPCGSLLVRLFSATGAFILTASHNPGGPDGDAGIKYNIHTGAPAPDDFNKALTTLCERCLTYRCMEPSRFARSYDALDLSVASLYRIGHTIVEVVDAVQLYTSYALSHFAPSLHVQLMLRYPHFGMFIDSMHAVGGPFITKVVESLVAHNNFEADDPQETKQVIRILQHLPIRCHLLHATPFPDFNNVHPDPSLVNNMELAQFASISTSSMYDNIIMGHNEDLSSNIDTIRRDSHSSCSGDKSSATSECTAIPPLARRYSLTSSFENFSSHHLPCSLGFAFDGDADRALVIGANSFVSPSDNLAIITALSWCFPRCFLPALVRKIFPALPTHTPPTSLQPCLRRPSIHETRFNDPQSNIATNTLPLAGITGVARSFPTSSALDHVCQYLEIPVFQTPTGFKYFGSLLDGGLIQLCGEESFGMGLQSIREKDGIMVALLWIHLCAFINESLLEEWKNHLLIAAMQDVKPTHELHYLTHDSLESVDNLITQSPSSVGSPSTIQSDLNNLNLPELVTEGAQTLYSSQRLNPPSLPWDLSSYHPSTDNHQEKPSHQFGLARDRGLYAADDICTQVRSQSSPPAITTPYHNEPDTKQNNEFRREQPYHSFPGNNAFNSEDTNILSQSRDDMLDTVRIDVQHSPSYIPPPLISVQNIQNAFYLLYGRCYYMRLDYHSVPESVEKKLYSNLSTLRDISHLIKKHHTLDNIEDPVICNYINSVVELWNKHYGDSRQVGSFTIGNPTTYCDTLQSLNVNHKHTELPDELKYDDPTDNDLSQMYAKNSTLQNPLSSHPVYAFIQCLVEAEEFIYHDPITNQPSDNHGFVLNFAYAEPFSHHLKSSDTDNRRNYRCVIRKSGTSTGLGCTVRMYIERYEPSVTSQSYRQEIHQSNPYPPENIYQQSALDLRYLALQLHNASITMPSQLAMSLGQSLSHFANVLAHLTFMAEVFPKPSSLT